MGERKTAGETKVQIQPSLLGGRGRAWGWGSGGWENKNQTVRVGRGALTLRPAPLAAAAGPCAETGRRFDSSPRRCCCRWQSPAATTTTTPEAAPGCGAGRAIPQSKARWRGLRRRTGRVIGGHGTGVQSTHSITSQEPAKANSSPAINARGWSASWAASQAGSRPSPRPHRAAGAAAAATSRLSPSLTPTPPPTPCRTDRRRRTRRLHGCSSPRARPRARRCGRFGTLPTTTRTTMPRRRRRRPAGFQRGGLCGAPGWPRPRCPGRTAGAASGPPKGPRRLRTCYRGVWGGRRPCAGQHKAGLRGTREEQQRRMRGAGAPAPGCGPLGGIATPILHRFVAPPPSMFFPHSTDKAKANPHQLEPEDP